MKLTEANQVIRAQNVSASEVGALVGSHPYTTPERIWDRLMGVEEERPTSEAMETGSFMEGPILRLAEKRLGIKARQNARTYAHKTVRLCATPDALVIGQPPGLVEIKMSGRPEIWRSVPEYVEWQVRAQMACTNRYTVAVCVLVGVGLRTFLIERDADLEDRMLAAVQVFWTDHILTGVRPEPIVEDLTLNFKGNGDAPR